MTRFLNPFVFTFTTLISLTFLYAFLRLNPQGVMTLLMALPFIATWLIPMVYWVGGRDKEGTYDHLLHAAGYLCMAFINFLIVSLIMTDLFELVITYSGMDAFKKSFEERRTLTILGLTALAFLMGFLEAKRGPILRQNELKFPKLPRSFDHFKIIQISDLHVGPTLHRDYVDRVVRMTQKLNPDIVVLTGDIVDGSVEKLLPQVEPLKDLKNAYLVLGNHDYYSGAEIWTKTFRELGITVLLNEHVLIKKNNEMIRLGGVTDPAAQSEKPDPQKSFHNGPAKEDNLFSILLAHHPKLAIRANLAGYDLQLSGHTHAGQFLPWTYVVRLIHKKFYWGLSREGKMQVFVSAGTGSWGPPIRLGTSPELSLLTLKRT